MRGSFVSVPRPFVNFDNLMRQFFHEGATSAGDWQPPMAVWEEGDKTYIELDLPGVDQKDLDITVEGGVLSVKGTRPAPTDRVYRHNERRFGEFLHTFRLPDAIDGDSVEASLNNGILTISLGKRPEALAKKIEVKLN